MNITTQQFAKLLNKSGAFVMSADRTCKLIYCKSDNEFRMYGPTGVHSLYAGATDRDRLNAHWTHFAR